jgi:hypothetical protein
VCRFARPPAPFLPRTGYADVFRRGAFAWENKAPGKNLDAALRQLLNYSLALSNPPILVVCDRLTIRIHTQFTGHPSETHSVLLAELAQPDKLALLRRIAPPAQTAFEGAGSGGFCYLNNSWLCKRDMRKSLV